MAALNHFVQNLPRQFLLKPGFATRSWQSLQMCSCFMMPGNFVFCRSRPVSSPIFSSSCIPAMSWPERSMESASGLSERIIERLRLENLFFSWRSSCSSCELVLQTRLDLFLSLSELVTMRLFLDLQLTPVAPTMISSALRLLSCLWQASAAGTGFSQLQGARQSEECLRRICSPPFQGFILQIKLFQEYNQALTFHAFIIPTLSPFYCLCRLGNCVPFEQQQQDYRMSSSWRVLRTIPKLQSFQKSLQLMDSEQIDLNIAEISLLTLNNENMMKWFIDSMAKYEFYLKYRYVLENLLNGKITATIKNQITFATSKYDEQFVNGTQQEIAEEQTALKKPLSKQRRLNFAIQKEEIIMRLHELSEEIFKVENDEEKRACFESRLAEINSLLSKKQEESSDSQSQGDEGKIKGLYICAGNSLRKISEIVIKNSYYIKTKNRHPIVLDFQFSKYLYKHDDQLAHEIIAMELIKYINAILGKEYIVPYEILPEKYGAFYEFVERSRTAHQVKSAHQNGSLFPYFNDLCEQYSTEAILTRFAQSYSGFCLIQYLLDIKDRNNANIMIREDGSIFHIDLAFIFESGPGGISFQSAPFKMTKQYVKILGGFQSDYFRKFQALLVQHFTKVFQCKDEFLWKMNILSRRSKQIRCFADFNYNAFCKKIPTKLEKVKSFVEDLIDKSYDSWKTTKYDDYQFKKNNICK